MLGIVVYIYIHLHIGGKKEEKKRKKFFGEFYTKGAKGALHRPVLNVTQKNRKTNCSIWTVNALILHLTNVIFFSLHFFFLTVIFFLHFYLLIIYFLKAVYCIKARRWLSHRFMWTEFAHIWTNMHSCDCHLRESTWNTPSARERASAICFKRNIICFRIQYSIRILPSVEYLLDLNFFPANFPGELLFFFVDIFIYLLFCFLSISKIEEKKLFN